VFCTHLHIDHTGWNTMLRDGRWVPTFPKAKYIFHKDEYAHREAMTKQGANPPGNVWTYNCRPIVEAGQALLVDDTFELDDTFSLTPTPGHSPHHCCVDIRSRGQHAVVTGDMMHHALQCREARLVHYLRRRQAASCTISPPLSGAGGRHRHTRPANSFP
jgi:glyoxylase-like metal-dependent hydrolase (beta-lactamase superfamily II)